MGFRSYAPDTEVHAVRMALKGLLFTASWMFDFAAVRKLYLDDWVCTTRTEFVSTQDSIEVVRLDRSLAQCCRRSLETRQAFVNHSEKTETKDIRKNTTGPVCHLSNAVRCDCVSPPLLDTVGSAVLAPMATLRAVYSPWLAFFSHQSASQSAAEPNVA
ncbi:hypothetical protein PTTG_26643 [Puccinia triticina 1-1 BBBD Race 1]|uniref:Uncharacterized protein n=1 Tax=Puccinia triticina (isolate 1-1 / race 1 (BBBD)) TaxID=630390 RepID=A0A180GRS8_PUCT1|nr:hypothetical protein PTTG_26643 [Puccinia triticina 1-1 BBBD Race 1]